MPITITIISILVITSLVWLLNKISPFKVCPICVGVSLTWLWMLVGILFGWLSVISYQLLVAVLMGSSVAGIAYQGEKKFGWDEEKAFYLKALFIVVGITFVYLVLNNLNFSTLILLLLVLGIVFYFYFIKKHNIQSKTKASEKIKALKKKIIEECC